MDETAERDRIAGRIHELCAQMEAVAEAQADDEADAILERNLARAAELHDLVAWIADRPVRNKGDLKRRTAVLLAYLACIAPVDEVRMSTVMHALERIFAYAQRSRERLPVAVCLATLML